VIYLPTVSVAFSFTVFLHDLLWYDTMVSLDLTFTAFRLHAQNVRLDRMKSKHNSGLAS